MSYVNTRSLWLIPFMLGLSLSTLQARTLLLMTDALEMPGAWTVNSDSGASKGVRRYLMAPTPDVAKAPAVGAIEVPHAGRWRLWVRSKDNVDYRPDTRLFSVRLGQTMVPRRFGAHGQRGDDGWAWEDGGVMDLPAGPLLTVLGEECKHSARCESLLLTDNMSYVPEGVSWQLNKEKAATVPVTLSDASRQAFMSPRLDRVQEKAVAALENELLRITFHEGHSASVPALGMRVATRKGDQWEPLSQDADAAGYRVLMRPLKSDPRITPGRTYPLWDMGMSPVVQVHAGAAEATTHLGPASAPWVSGRCFAILPVSAKQRDEHTVELTFAPTPAGQLYVTWVLDPGRSDVLVRMSFKPAQPGHYSLGFHGPLSVPPQDADSWLLPFQFHANRFPAEPVLLLNATTPTPMTLVNRGGVSCALVADPASIPFEWQAADTSRFGFGLRNETGMAQPMIYSPVLGLPGSRSNGEELSTRFRVWVQRGDWYATYRRVADELFGLKDYREPTTFSLTDTAFNLIDLMRDEAASGWDARAKGSLQIESRNVVTQSSPLLYMSLYLLTGDEDFYQRFARPSLEFLLSRPEAHFAVEKEIGDNYYRHQPMQGPVRLYGASTYASALAMTHGRTAALGGMALLPDGNLRRTPPNSHAQPFDDALMLHRITGDQRWLGEAMENADAYLSTLQGRSSLYDPYDKPFVNVAFAPNWEGLLHMFEVTGEERYRKAAVEGARALLTTLWTQPRIPGKDITLNPGGVYDHSRSIWWWGDLRKRVGVYEGPAQEGPIETPPPKIPERRVPAWIVSNIGLGLEHPFTYVRGGGQANIMMSTWVPNLLRVSEISGDPAFRVAARNAMIGRYATYPGYYLDGQTDEFRRPDYAVKGPDITSLYLHHIPSFAASVLDFLFTDAELRSKGQVSFPWVRQMGYVWFDSRLWGHAPGKVYGDEAWPWLHRTAATVDNPGVDHLLAQGSGKMHVILLNQRLTSQTVRVRFDEKILGTKVEGATLTTHLNNSPGSPLTIKDGTAQVSIPVKGFAVLTLDGVKIDVPTQRIKPPAHIALSEAPAQTKAKIGTTSWQAIATMIDVPPFTWRDLHVYVNAAREDLQSATLRCRLGTGPEQRLEVKSFPFEFSLRLADPTQPISWTLDAQLPDHTQQSTSLQVEPGKPQ